MGYQPFTIQGCTVSSDKSKRLVLTGVSGIIGRKIVENLKLSHNCTIVTRGNQNFSHLEQQGVQIRHGSLENTSLLTDVFQQCDTALVMMIAPPQLEIRGPFQRKIAESLFTALKASNVRQIIHLSCIGAGRPDKTGVITGSYELERMLNWLRTRSILHLRPAFFMETLFQHLFYNPEKNILQSTLAPNLHLPLVSISDVAEIVSKNLQSPDFSGQTIQHILGPEELTMSEITAIIGKATGNHDLAYRQATREEMEYSYLACGCSATWAAEWLSCFNNLEKEDDLFGKTVNHMKTSTTFADAMAFCHNELYTFFENSITVSATKDNSTS